MSNREIADCLVISVSTVQNHLHHSQIVGSVMQERWVNAGGKALRFYVPFDVVNTQLIGRFRWPGQGWQVVVARDYRHQLLDRLRSMLQGRERLLDNGSDQQLVALYREAARVDAGDTERKDRLALMLGAPIDDVDLTAALELLMLQRANVLREHLMNYLDRLATSQHHEYISALAHTIDRLMHLRSMLSIA